MPARRAILLTGATGLLGRHLLKDLLLSGRRVAVLVRDSRQADAAERVRQVVAFWSNLLKRPLPTPLVVTGNLNVTGLGLGPTERQWLSYNCGAILHAAASLSYRENPDGEPLKTNVEGTQRLIQLSQALGISEWHHVSTAFVCGTRSDLIGEGELDTPAFHNAYERSKSEAEQFLHDSRGLLATIYRPAVIVGDRATGYTSTYTGVYRFLELAALLAESGDGHVPVRLPMTGEERFNLVPVDWVSGAIVRMLERQRWHGRTFHLASTLPVTARRLVEVASEELGFEGIQFAGPGDLDKRSPLEERVMYALAEYWPYLNGNPRFDRSNTIEALPDFLPPVVDRAVLQRLIRFAVRDDWGRTGAGRRPRSRVRVSACADYIERIFPQQARRSPLARAAGLHLSVSFDIEGIGGGRWSCRWCRGELVYVRRGLDPDAEVTYRTDTATLAEIVEGKQSPQEAFMQRRVAFVGNMETALKLAVLFGEFLRENPYSPGMEARDAAALEIAAAGR
jgi:thioester reductase-like protein/predicted lipid carrier protein YhbT